MKSRRIQGRSAAEVYRVQPYYQRFNQKFVMNRQHLWDEEAASTRRKRGASLKRLAESGRVGYTQLDWALLTAARANTENADFGVLNPNRHGNYWRPLASRNGSAPSKNTPSFSRWQGNPEAASALMYGLSLRFGANQAGFCALDRRWVYSHWFDEETRREYPIKFSDEPGYEDISQPSQLEDGTQVIPKEMKYVIVLLHDQRKEVMATAPALTAQAETALGYSRIAFTTVSLAEFIRSLGYNAIPSANCTALSIPLAIDAGLGQLGRNAKLVSPLFGPRCRISKVITDLPLAVARPVELGITEFCDRCRKCATKCPARAIPAGARSFEPANECNHRGVLQWQVDHKKCEDYCAELGTNCGICVRVCPFNKGRGRIHGVARWLIKNAGFLDPLLIGLDDALGYGRRASPEDTLWREVRRLEQGG